MDKNKEYELVKDFPGRNIGDIIYWAEEPVERWFWKTGGCIPPDLTRDLQGLPKLEEWFEEVVEKEYEILSFRTSQDSGNSWQISRRISNGRFLWDKYSEKDLPLKGVDKNSDGMGATEEYMLNEWVNDPDYQRCEINSIRRKSDGEIFTIGDRVDENVTGTTYGWNISEFSLKDNRCFTCGVNITCIKKIKETLFVTFDGIEITDSEQVVYIVSNNEMFNLYCKKAINAKNQQRILGFNIFSTLKSAKNYIKCHKPVLSYNDVQKLYDKLSHVHVRDHYKKELTKLVESKL